MMKWLTAFFLLAVTTGGAATGMPLHSGGKGCHTTGVMDCCAKARMTDDKPEFRAARVCCALNCTEPGAPPPGGSSKVSPPQAVVIHSALVMPPASLASQELPRDYSPSRLVRQSHPAYIRHLALLI